MSAVSESAIPIRPAGFRPRLDQLDLLRGAVMILMALDHVRDFFSRDALQFDPTDLSQTTGALFLTRWITHFCAPVFVFLAGTGAFLSLGRGKTKGELSWFLLTRGAWLVLLELTLVNSSWSFGFDPHFFFLQVIWAIGWSMIALAGLLHLPFLGVAAVGILMIVLHNLLDGLQPAAFGSWSGIWKVLHVQGAVSPAANYTWFVAYPLIPWIGVLAAGFCFGAIMKRERAERRRILLGLGLGLMGVFLLLRFSNFYGDPRPWSAQGSALFTVFSFLNCEKYPPSLLYLLMTLGPAMLLLAVFDRELGAWSRPIIVFGRVPLFYYLLHLPLIHGLAVALSYVQHGNARGIWNGPLFGPASSFPENYGYSIIGVYLVWFLVIFLLYWPCRWFAGLKQRRRDVWLSYF